ncbi:cbb3-type cytochrome oxidase assembly protein CcoS [Hydrogenophaga sp.]|jgi:cbb3-type cytochrome oxidase maturation protein|nr:cbb3-type cytochrome oxidase assembly protein CcoS [uncultured Aquabacterium sp.]
MEILYVLLPVSVLLVLAILAILGWAVNSGQFEDIEQEGIRILSDESQKVEDNVERHQI